MPALLDVRKRISAVGGMRKITQAMELVAASKMRRFQEKALAKRAYAHGLVQGLNGCGVDISEIPFVGKREKGPVLFVLIASDRGLCGGLNAQLARSLFRSKRWQTLAPAERKLVTMGRKAFDQANQEGMPVMKRFDALSDELSTMDALKIAEHLLGYWTRQECREIVLVSPKFINAFTYQPTMKTYLPFDGATLSEEDIKANGGAKPDAPWMIFEPSRSRLIERLSHQLVWSFLVAAFYELKASEYSSRMVAMRKATDAADDIIKTMTLEYHKARQSAITQQIAELAGAGEAMQSETQVDYIYA